MPLPSAYLASAYPILSAAHPRPLGLLEILLPIGLNKTPWSFAATSRFFPSRANQRFRDERTAATSPSTPELNKDRSNMRFHDPTWKYGQRRWIQNVMDSRGPARREKQLMLFLFLHLSLFYSFLQFISIKQTPQRTSLHTAVTLQPAHHQLLADIYQEPAMSQMQGLEKNQKLTHGANPEGRYMCLHFADEEMEASRD